MTDTTTKDVTLIITKPAILSYPHLAAPQKTRKPTDTPKYGATFVFAAGTDLAEMQAAVLEAGATKFPGIKNLVEAFTSGILKSPFRKDAVAKGYAEGSIFINARSERQPGCVYLHAEPGTDKPAKVPQDKIIEVFYPGAIVLGQLRAFGYDSEGNKGVSFALNNIQKFADAARIDNRVSAEDAFKADLSTAPASLNSLL